MSWLLLSVAFVIYA